MKPRIKCYYFDGSWWYQWIGRGVWRIDSGDHPKTWREIQYCYPVPFVGY